MIAPLTEFIDWSVLQTADVIGCLGQMSLIFRMVFLATALPVFPLTPGGQRGRATNHSAVAGGDRIRFEGDQKCRVEKIKKGVIPR